MKNVIAAFVLTLPLGLNAQNIVLTQHGGQLTVQQDAELTVQGGFEIREDAVLQLDGKLTVASNAQASQVQLLFSGASTMPGNGTIVLATDREVAFKGGQINIPSLLVNHSGPAQILLQNDVVIRNSLTLTKGVLNTYENRLHIQSPGPDAVLAGAGNQGFSQSFVAGNLRRSLVTNDDYYHFPVGSLQAGPRPLTLINQNLTGVSFIDASFGPKNGSDDGLALSEDGAGYSTVHTGGVWQLSANANPTSGNYILHANLAGFNGLLDNHFGLLLRTIGTQTGADWKIPNGSSLPGFDKPGQTLASGYARRLGIRAFGEFGLGITTSPLPVTLISFSGKALDDGAHHLEWKTVDEKDFDRFEIEVSQDGKSFVKIGEVAAQNSPGTHDYSFLRPNPVTDENYYRLRMVDTDGSFAFSKLVSLKALIKNVVYPNPVANGALVSFSHPDQVARIEILDKTGTVVFLKSNGAKSFSLDSLRPGLYLVRVCLSDGSKYAQKIIKL